MSDEDLELGNAIEADNTESIDETQETSRILRPDGPGSDVRRHRYRLHSWSVSL